MAADQLGGQSQNRAWFRLARPLLGWLLLVLALFGLVSHQRALETTRLNFTVTLAGRPLFSDAEAVLDGKPTISGQRLSLGHHSLTIIHPKARTFITNFFVWYGEHDLGALKLERAAGTLTITANPPAQAVKISGPEWHQDLTNVSTEKLTAPTDEYTVTAVYPYFTTEKTVVVGDGQSALCAFTPVVGALQANFGYAGAPCSSRKS